MSQKNNAQRQLDSLRDSYISYQESASRCKTELRARNLTSVVEKLDEKPKKQQDGEYSKFYIPPNIPQLDEPEKQKKYRKDYIEEVGSRPEPEKVELLADQLHLEAMNIVSDRSTPHNAREDLAAFYKRYSVSLQHKKYKMLGRWANQATHSKEVDIQSVHFDRMVGRLQKEMDSANNRSVRLSEDDEYNTGVDKSQPRPQPTSQDENGARTGTLLYAETPGRVLNSSIRHDDIEVHLRIKTYREKLFRIPQKLSTSIKWLPYSRRFDIWAESRKRISEFKSNYSEERTKILIPVGDRVKQYLIDAGVADEKTLMLVKQKYTQHLETEELQSRNITALNSHKLTHQKPPFLQTSNIELKFVLMPLAKASLNIDDAIGRDDGHNFSYQVQGYFAPEFQKQTLAMQFDWIDSGEATQQDTDMLLIEKLTTELGLDKNEMLAEMAKQAEVERGKGILGELGKGSNQQNQSKSSESEDNAKTNLIRRIKEMKFFSLDETDCKLQKADWLEYVCWQPTVDDQIKRQNNRLTSQQENPIDSLLLSAFEFIDVNEAGAANKILEDAATAHIRKVRSYFTELSKETQVHDHENCVKAEEAILKQAVKKSSMSDKLNNNADKPDESSNYNKDKVEDFLQNVDPLKQNLIKAYYTLRLLKSRETKVRMIQALNYFRGVQRRLAHDVREFYTRERALGGQQVEETLIGPQFGTDELGHLKAKQCGTQGPGGINANRLPKELEDGNHTILVENGKECEDPISIKGYKFNKRFNPILSSTCPCLPRFHTTFGRPTLYEEVSQDIERKTQPGTSWRHEARPIVAYKDRLVFQAAASKKLLDCEIAVFDEHGIRIVYEETLNDMIQLEEEMIKIGSHFLNRAEMLQHQGTSEQPSTMLDRGEVTQELFESELELQLTKIELVEILMEVYEHTCDPLESVRILQIVADTMAIRPRVNLEATYFKDSYTAEIEVLRNKIELYRQIIEIQRQFEFNENTEVRKFQELKMRKLLDFVNGNWKYHDAENKQEVMGTKEEWSIGQGHEKARQGKRAQEMKELTKQLALKEIAERHITEFAGDQHTDFANVLGLPEVTAQSLFKKQAELEPLVIDAIREHSHFSKQTEGYPWFFTQESKSDKNASTGFHSSGAGLTDFFESFCCITRIHAACDQAFSELSRLHRPENGIAGACLESAMLAEARGALKIIQNPGSEGALASSRSLSYLQEDSYLGSSDKLIFLLRDLKAELHPERIEAWANPLLVAKLEVSEVAKFNFPKVKAEDVTGTQGLSDEVIAEKMITLAKVAVVRKFGDDVNAQGGAGAKAASGEEQDEAVKEKQVQSISLLQMACNLIEALRLRQDLIQLLHESDVLSLVYSQQLQQTGKSAWKLVGNDGIQFETQSISKDSLNLVDHNDGSSLDFDLAALEFDKTLGASLDFRSESCVKALMTTLGVEELRAVVHYQMMQKQLLVVGMIRNQILMDGSQQGSEELKMLKLRPPVTVPAAVVRLDRILSRNSDGINSIEAKHEDSRISSCLSKEVAEHMYSIASRKGRHRQHALKKYNQLMSRVVSQPTSIEQKLRILRSYRITLLHEFCQMTLSEAYQDSTGIQTILACKELRWQTQYFPKTSSPFRAGILNAVEHFPINLINQSENFLNSPIYADGGSRACLDDLVKGKPSTLLYIPSSTEILEVIRIADGETDCQTSVPPSNPDSIDFNKIDDLIKNANIQPSMYSKLEQLALPLSRQVSFKEAYSYETTGLKLLQFYSHLCQITSLEYLMGRNNAPGSQVLTLEASLLTGQPFFTDTVEPHQNLETLQGAPERVVAKIVNARRAKMDLAEDLSQIALKLSKIDSFVKKGTRADQTKLPYLLELMRLNHQSSYLHFMNGLEQAFDIYLDHNSNANFAKVQNEIFTLSRRDHGFNLLGNGMYISQGTRHAADIDPGAPMLRDYAQFDKCYQPIIDENALVPPQLGLVRRLFGHNALTDAGILPSLAGVQVPCYSQMRSSLLNVDDEQRAFIGSNFLQLEEGVTEYLQLQGIIPNPNAKPAADGSAPVAQIVRPAEVLKGTVDFLGLKVESRNLQRVLMAWTTGKALPLDTISYKSAQKVVRDQTMLQVLLERDSLSEAYYARKGAKRSTAEAGSVQAQQDKMKKDKKTILESVNLHSAEYNIVNAMHQTKAEISVGLKLLDSKMVDVSLNMIRNEHAALQAAFEQGAAAGVVQAFVHPQQQFAATLYQSVDENSHLNVINKLDFVQSFLTKLRNRCTEVETLASGPGIVFSIKDFNECLQTFCSGVLKYGETELRSRVETQHIRENQYQHLLYMKEKQALYYKRKCEQFLGDLDKLVNAKISQKGSQLLYELDVSQRELRVLRDNYGLMQKMMTQELRHEYLRAIQERDAKITRLQGAKAAEEQRVRTTTVEDVREHFKDLQSGVERKRIDAANSKAPLKGSQPNRGGVPTSPTGLAQPPQPDVSSFEAEALGEVLALQNVIRRNKAFAMIKTVLAAERHEKELANQRAQLTSNAALWDQLAEAEKREQITKQELNLTKLSLASYEKLIEKLQGQLETLNSQKARLQQYKTTESKRTSELENKMKDLEILENIDLNKILTELKSRDKKIASLSQETHAQKDELKYVVHQQNQKDMQKVLKRLSHEREMKLQAYDRLEGLRVEMRALEGQDMKSDLWKDKCRDLFDICKDLEKENDQLKGLVSDANQAHLLKSDNEQVDAYGGVQERDGAGKSFGPAGSAEGRSNFGSRAGEVVISNRTSGTGRLGQRNDQRGVYTNSGVYSSVLQGGLVADGYESLQPQQLTQKGGLFSGDPSQGTRHPTHHETLHSENPISSHAGYPNAMHQQLAEAQGLISLGSGAGLVAQTLNAGLPGFGGEGQNAGVLAAPLQSFGQPRSIMTAGAGTRPHRGGTQGSVGIAAAKRLQTSQGQRARAPLAKAAGSKESYGQSIRSSTNRPQLFPPATGAQYSTYNPAGSQGIPSLGIRGKSTGLPGAKGRKNGGFIKQGSANQLGNAQTEQQAMNFNINFNTTHINMQK